MKIFLLKVYLYEMLYFSLKLNPSFSLHIQNNVLIIIQHKIVAYTNKPLIFLLNNINTNISNKNKITVCHIDVLRRFYRCVTSQNEHTFFIYDSFVRYIAVMKLRRWTYTKYRLFIKIVQFYLTLLSIKSSIQALIWLIFWG